MGRVISPFVGYRPDLKHPFAVASNHSEALSALMDERLEKCFKTTGIPGFFGFVIKSDDGTYRYADRAEAFTVARIAGQLLNDYKVSSLESYMFNTVSEELPRLRMHSERINSMFTGMSVTDDIKIVC